MTIDAIIDAVMALSSGPLFKLCKLSSWQLRIPAVIRDPLMSPILQLELLEPLKLCQGQPNTHMLQR